MRAYDGEKVISLQELTSCLIPSIIRQLNAMPYTGRRLREKIRAASDMIVDKGFGNFLLPKIFHGIGPEDIAHQAVGRRLAESIKLQPGADE